MRLEVVIGVVVVDSVIILHCNEKLKRLLKPSGGWLVQCYSDSAGKWQLVSHGNSVAYFCVCICWSDFGGQLLSMEGK